MDIVNSHTACNTDLVRAELIQPSVAPGDERSAKSPVPDAPSPNLCHCSGASAIALGAKN